MIERRVRPWLCLLVAVCLVVGVSVVGGRAPVGVRVDDGTPPEVTLIDGAP